MDEWRGKWALVTGASAGIGAALAEELAAGGANLVLVARRRERLEELATRLRGEHKVSVEVMPADLTERAAREELFAATQRKGIAIELLVNNAGFGAYGEFPKTPLERLLEMIAVNVTAVTHLTHLFLQSMIERKRGDVLILSSTAAFQGVPYLAAYAATKSFDLIFGEGLAEELQPHGIRVCVLCPGSTVSEFHAVGGLPDFTKHRQETPQEVARTGLRALAKGKSSVVVGFLNWLGVQSQGIAPRRLPVKVSASLFKPRE
jgi:short-subunit dehydrogenase